MKALTAVAAALLTLVASHAFAQSVDQPKNEAWEGPSTSVQKTPLTPDPLDADAAQINPGDPLPDFQVASSLDRKVRPGDLRGHWSALVFDESPRPFVPIEALADSLQALHVTVYGISRADSLADTGAKPPTRLVLLADPDADMARSFGMYDATTDRIKQGLLVSDPRGVVRLTLPGASMDPARLLGMIRYAVQGT